MAEGFSEGSPLAQLSELVVWCTPGAGRNSKNVTKLRVYSSVLANDELRDTRQLSEATADLG